MQQLITMTIFFYTILKSSVLMISKTNTLRSTGAILAGRGANVAGSMEEFAAVPIFILDINDCVDDNVAGGGGIEETCTICNISKIQLRY